MKKKFTKTRELTTELIKFEVHERDKFGSFMN